MTHIDFLIGTMLLLSSLFLIVYFVSNSITNNVNSIKEASVSESAVTIEKYFFDIDGEYSLTEDASTMQAFLTEENGTAHSEIIAFSIKPQISSIKVYDSFWNEVASSFSQSSGETVLTLDLGFSPNEKKDFNIVYFSHAEEANYLSAGNNVSVILVVGENLKVVSQQKCSELQAKSYEDVKSGIDFKHNFKIEVGDCSYGSSPPLTTNIFIRNIPVIFENSDSTLSPVLGRLSVW